MQTTLSLSRCLSENVRLANEHHDHHLWHRDPRRPALRPVASRGRQQDSWVEDRAQDFHVSFTS